MQKAPFLVTYGGFVWKLLVVSAAVIAIAISARKAYRHRARRGNAHRWVWSQVALVLFRAAVAAIAVTLLLILIGRVAMGIAGDRPFEGRNDDQVSQLDPVAIAAATPVYRPRALEKFAAAVTGGRALSQTPFRPSTPSSRPSSRPPNWWGTSRYAGRLPAARRRSISV